jgi:hypothetical protein
MDHFENIVATLLEADGYWVRQSFKVNLTKDEKVRIQKHSIPRPEIDLLALKLDRNEIIAFEAKSFLDSPGVDLTELKESHEQPTGRYKLFTCEPYRTIVLNRLLADLVALGMATPKTQIRLGLAAGKIRSGQSDALEAFMRERRWEFWSPELVKQKVEALVRRGYENDPAIITAKILMR